MKLRQRTEVSMVTHEITVLRIHKAPMFCGGCEAITAHLSMSEAISVLSLTAGEIRRLAESGEIHYTAGADGSLQLCGNSAITFHQGRS